MLIRALVVGKFAPLHKGHDYLIRTAIANSDQVVILHYGSDEVGVDSSRVRNALLDLYSCKSVMIPKMPPIVPLNAAPELVHRNFCAKILEELTYVPTCVFTSESYGDGFADYLSMFFNSKVTHNCVDINRTMYPISGTLIRSTVSNNHWSLM